MMQLKKKLTVVFAMLAGVSVCAAAVAACSSDDTTVTADSGTPETSKPETSTPDTGPTEDTGPGDAGKDVIQVEAATIADFIDQNTLVMCQRLKECCGVAADVDITRCVAGLKTNGWAGSLVDITGAGADTSKLTYDSTTGSACVTAARNLACDLAPAADYKDSWTKCFAATKGTVANGASCKSSAECMPTAYCETVDSGIDGGACRPLQANGTTCDPNQYGIECSYRGVGSSQCADKGTGPKCTNLLNPNGAQCALDQECASGACFYGDGGVGGFGVCSDKQTWYNQTDCVKYGKDAGDGG